MIVNSLNEFIENEWVNNNGFDGDLMNSLSTESESVLREHYTRASKDVTPTDEVTRRSFRHPRR
jgi:hypothetical protein